MTSTTSTTAEDAAQKESAPAGTKGAIQSKHLDFIAAPACGQEVPGGTLPMEVLRPMDYDTIKALAKERGVPVQQMLALAVQNDPFYVGQPAQRTAGEWFAKWFDAAGFVQGVHLRRVHYYLVSVEANLPNGKPYENTLEAWQFLAQASKCARYLGLVDVAAFDDRRNPPAQVFYTPEPNEGDIYIEGDDPELPVLTMPELPRLTATPPSAQQPYALEIWCEKSTMNDVLMPLCRKFGAVLVTGLGELSVTACHLLVERAQASGKPTRIIYLSDFDPAGQSMPVAVSRKIEFLARDRNLNIQLRAVGLTAEQVKQFNLPRVPIKESERRRERFEETYGTGAVELDALEALVPGELARIVTDAVLPYFDESLQREIDAAHADAVEQADAVEEQVYAEHADAIAGAKKQWQAIRRQVEEWHQQHAPVWQAISADLGAAELEIGYPEADVSGDADSPLFDSQRGYEEQLRAYKAFRSGGTQ